MHGAVHDWVRSSFLTWRMAHKEEQVDILEFGSLDINGSVRSIFEPFTKSYLGIDPQEGPGVDLVADAITWRSKKRFDVVVCTEVFEHCEEWAKIVANSYNHLKKGGLFIATMAGEGRGPHSAIDENPIRDWEYYKNVTKDELAEACSPFAEVHLDKTGTDLRCWAIK